MRNHARTEKNANYFMYLKSNFNVNYQMIYKSLCTCENRQPALEARTSTESPGFRYAHPHEKVFLSEIFHKVSTSKKIRGL